MSTLETAAGPLPNVSNYQIIRRLLKFRRPFNGWMLTSLTSGVV